LPTITTRYTRAAVGFSGDTTVNDRGDNLIPSRGDVREVL